MPETPTATAPAESTSWTYVGPSRDLVARYQSRDFPATFEAEAGVGEAYAHADILGARREFFGADQVVFPCREGDGDGAGNGTAVYDLVDEEHHTTERVVARAVGEGGVPLGWEREADAVDATLAAGLGGPGESRGSASTFYSPEGGGFLGIIARPVRVLTYERRLPSDRLVEVNGVVLKASMGSMEGSAPIQSVASGPASGDE